MINEPSDFKLLRFDLFFKKKMIALSLTDVQDETYKPHILKYMRKMYHQICVTCKNSNQPVHLGGWMFSLDVLLIAKDQRFLQVDSDD